MTLFRMFSQRIFKDKNNDNDNNQITPIGKPKKVKSTTYTTNKEEQAAQDIHSILKHNKKKSSKKTK